MGCCHSKKTKSFDTSLKDCMSYSPSYTETRTRPSEIILHERRMSKQKFTGLDPRVSLNSQQEREIINGQQQKSALTSNQKNFIMKTLSAHFIFNSLTTENIKEIANSFKVFSFDTNKVIFSQGHFGQNFYIIESGSVEVLLNSEPKAILTAGGYFGEIALIYNTKRTATIRTIDKVSCFVLKGDSFRKAIRSVSTEKLEENRRFLLSLWFFNKLTDQQKETFLSLVVVQKFKPRQRIVREGEKGKLMYLVKEGLVSVSVKGVQQRTLGPGEYFGEQSEIYKTYRTASVDAIDQVVLLCFNFKDLVDLLGTKLEYVIFRNSLRICIEKTKYLKKLSRDQKESIVKNAEIESFEDGQILAEKGEKISNKIVFVLKGEVCSGKHKFGKFSIIGELELYLNKNKSFSCPLQVSEKAFVAQISSGDVLRILNGDLKSSIKKGKLITILKSVPIFRTLPYESLEKLIFKLAVKKFPNKHIICSQGDPGLELYIVKSGKVKVKIDTKTIRLISKYDFFGERSLLFEEPRSATIISKSCECWVLQKEDFLELINEKTQEYLLNKIEMQNDEVEFNDLGIVKLLGKGTFGVVFLAQNTNSGQFYALKTVPRSKIESFHIRKNLLQEKNIMSMLDHPFIDKLIKTFKDSHRVYFLMELVQGLDLFDLLRKFPLWDEDKTRFYISCIILILEQLHEYKIIHRDLKPENIIVDKDGYPKLIDFGVAKVVSGRTYTVAGTSHYMAPEVIRGTGYGIEADYWSLGIILYEFLCNKVPWGEHEEDPIHVYNLILRSKLEFPEKLENEACKTFIQKLLSHLPAMRGDIEAIKKNVWLSGVDFEKLLAKMVDAPFRPQVEDLNKLAKNVKKGKVEVEKFIVKFESEVKMSKKETELEWDFDF